MKRTPLTRRTPLRQGRGTSFPARVVEHVKSHQEGCIGPKAGMPGDCAGAIQSDHVRASGGIGMKSDSIAVNCARLCALTHHPMKTRDGREWRPWLLVVIARLHGACASCQRESIETYGTPLLEGIA